MGTVSMLRQNNIEELYFDCFKCAIKDVLRRIRHGRADHSMLIRFGGLSNRCIQKACVKFEDSSITTGDARCRQSCSAGIICSSSGIIRFDLDASTGCFELFMIGLDTVCCLSIVFCTFTNDRCPNSLFLYKKI